MEVNGRYWGSLRCSIAAGVDFPKRHYQSALSLLKEPDTYELNVCSRWEVGEIMWLFFSRGNFFDKLKILSKNGFRDNYDFLTRDDPLPFLVFIWIIIGPS